MYREPFFVEHPERQLYLAWALNLSVPVVIYFRLKSVSGRVSSDVCKWWERTLTSDGRAGSVAHSLQAGWHGLLRSPIVMAVNFTVVRPLGQVFKFLILSPLQARV